MRFRRRALALPLAVALACGTAPLLSRAAGAANRPAGDVRLVVGFARGASTAQIAAADHRAGVRALSELTDLHARVVTAPSSAAANALAVLRADAIVRFAEVDGTAEPTDVIPNDPYFPTGTGALGGGEWGSASTQAPAAWGITTGSSAVTVAVVDSGVVATQPDLAPVLTAGWNVLTGTSDTSDVYGHGTEVAGVAVAASNNGQGVAAYCWQCRLMPIKVYDSASAYDSDIAKGITWAVDHGAKVVNVSLAGTSGSSVLDSAANYAATHGVLVVAAAGNNGNSTPTYPAASPGVLSVAASDQTDTLYSYSDYGTWVDLAAPGATPTTLPNGAYGAVGGTSIASPAVAGIAALLFSAAPTATPADAVNALVSTTDPTSGARSAAHGRVNARNALVALTGTSGWGGTGTTTAVPVASLPPVVSGGAQSGQTLTVTSGTWSGNPTSYAYQWQRCDGSGANCAAVPGATASTYALGAADVGSTMRAVVVASNSAGSASATSAPTAPVSAATTTVTFTGSLTKSAMSRSYAVSLMSGPVRGDLSFSKCSALSLALVTSGGSVLAQATGPSTLTVSGTVNAGNYEWVVSGSCRVSFALTSTSG
jgi:thermitase